MIKHITTKVLLLLISWILYQPAISQQVFSSTGPQIKSTKGKTDPLFEQYLYNAPLNKDPLQSIFTSEQKNTQNQILPNPTTTFTLKLLQNIPTSPNDNLIISPLSAQYLLSLLERGAGGETKKQLQFVTGSKGSQEINKVLKENAVGLKSAAGIFHDNQITIKDSYKKKFNDNLAIIQNLDFIGKSELAKNSINKWASDRTGGHISNLIPQNFDLSSVNLVLISAIYFNNMWKYKFKPIGNEEFTTGESKAVTTPFMEITQNIVFYEINFNGHECNIISLPYETENKYSMVLIYPTKFVPLDNLIEKMDARTLNEVISTLDDKFPRHTTLQMPKFKLKSSQSLVKPLKKMSLTDVFGSQSNLTGISTSTNLYVSEVLQQATLDVDEKGTVATAATSALLIPLSANSDYQPTLLVINRPFISIIIDNQYKTPLFISKINNPAL